MSEPRHSLHEHLFTVAQAAVLERGIGFTKLSNLTDINKRTLTRTFKHRTIYRQLGMGKLILILDALGYGVELHIRERGLSDAQRAYFAADPAECRTEKPISRIKKASSDITIRALGRSTRVRSGGKKAVAPAARKSRQRNAVATEANVVD